MADEESRSQLVAQFTAISGVDTERAKFFLESAAWNLESALSSFYEEGEDEGAGGDIGGDDLGERPEAEGAPSTPQRPASQPSALQKAIVDMMDHDSDSDEEGQAFYAGGSEHSGQQVLGPPRKKGDMVAKLFKSAKEHGAEVLEGGKDGKKPKKINFGGTGYRLGETSDDTQVIPDTSARVERPRDVSLKMWKAGFTVDDGPFRAYDDPANARFLDSIRRSEVPLELVREARGGEVYINMEDHRHEDYVQPRHSLKAFSGSGHTLGSPAPTVVSQADLAGIVEGAASLPSAASSSREQEKSAQDNLEVNADQPTTTIQLRLPDGTRLQVKLNHTHTVGQLRQFLLRARPSFNTVDFALMTTFPYAELTDTSKTLADAKLLNSAIVVKNK